MSGFIYDIKTKFEYIFQNIIYKYCFFITNIRIYFSLDSIEFDKNIHKKGNNTLYTGKCSKLGQGPELGHKFKCDFELLKVDISE